MPYLILESFLCVFECTVGMAFFELSFRVPRYVGIGTKTTCVCDDAAGGFVSLPDGHRPVRGLYERGTGSILNLT